MPSPFENLSGQGKALKAEPPDANEFAGLQRSMPCVSRHCDGMDTAPPIGLSSFNFCRIRLTWVPRYGVCCPNAMTFAISVNTQVI